MKPRQPSPCQRQRAAIAVLVASLLLPMPLAAIADQVAAIDGLFNLPSTYRNVVPPGLPAATGQTHNSSGPWWERYGSRELNQLVDRALANNPDLRISTLQMAQARIRADQTRAGSLPFVSAPFRTVSQSGGTTADGLQSSQAAVQATYRLDIWGEQKALESSAELQMLRAVYERQNVERNVIGNLVVAYLAWLEINDSITFARDNEGLTRRMLQAVEQKFTLGDATISEVEMQRAATFLAAAQLASMENQRDDYLTVIARVLGTTVSQVKLTGQGLDDFSLPSLNAGLPSRLLLQRPDVRLVEARLSVAKADIEVARARLLPPIDLSAQAGYSALGLASLVQPQNLIVNAIASLAVTIFDGGRRAGDKASADLNREQLVETYAQTILQAVREVESAVSAFRTARLRADAQLATLRASMTMYKAAVDAYTADALDLGSVLEAKRSLQRNQDDWQKSRSEALRAYAGVAFALGGGRFDDPASAAHAAQAPATPPEGLLISESGKLPAGAGWVVELAPLAHKATLEPAWRDLQRRFAGSLRGKRMAALREGGITNKTDEPEAWYRLSVTGFGGQSEADAFCGAMRQGLQACKVVQHGS